MGGTLGPLVQGSFLSLQRRILVSVLFATTFAIGALSTFTIASLLGAGLVRPSMPTPWRVAGNAIGLALLAALDLLAIRKNVYCPLSLRRQTPKGLARRHGVLATAAMWGFDLGTAVSTFRVAAATWGALLLVAWGWAPPWTGLFYTAGFTAPLLFLMWTGRLPSKAPERGSKSLQAMLDRRRPAQWLSAGLLATGAALAAVGKLG
jgi:hypothetical protein